MGSDIRLPDTFPGRSPLRPYRCSGVERPGISSIDLSPTEVESGIAWVADLHPPYAPQHSCLNHWYQASNPWPDRAETWKILRSGLTWRA